MNTAYLLTGKEVWSTLEKQIQENDNDPKSTPYFYSPSSATLQKTQKFA